jgi:hypothetical protein
MQTKIDLKSFDLLCFIVLLYLCFLEISHLQAQQHIAHPAHPAHPKISSALASKIGFKSQDLKDSIENQQKNNRTLSESPKYLLSLAYQEENAFLFKGGLRKKNELDFRHWTLINHVINLDRFNILSKHLKSISLGTLLIQNMWILEDPFGQKNNQLVNDAHGYSNLMAENRLQFFQML